MCVCVRVCVCVCVGGGGGGGGGVVGRGIGLQKVVIGMRGKTFMK